MGTGTGTVRSSVAPFKKMHKEDMRKGDTHEHTECTPVHKGPKPNQPPRA